jgi:uncharacterized protein (TIGR03067 family)
MLRTLMVAALCVLGVGSALAQDDVKKELAKMEGTWGIVSAEENKKALPAAIKDNLKLVIKGNVLTFKGDDNTSKKAGKITLKIDPSTMPKTIDFTIEVGTEKGQTLEGIYDWQGKELRFCVRMMGNERPTEFATAPGSNLVLMVLKRE